ncbi:uncharacterized protein LOC127243451 [Andrographis paniculata]|uniref:uncharacterized protein LOC127243451 n=1 Tax=Andrographis paniculata TaxID=175694 RepID=UPI0021E8D668|nr:uncharacterized protein LOC127243451 [Andrographis paniculata]
MHIQSDLPTPMQNNGVSGGDVKPEDVIVKLKDDGDFDRLRLKIIRKLKDNEELRSNIIAMVKQSVALNRPGAENMKPRQLSDAIHQEIGDKLMSQVSDGLWNIIRSPDGMKSEITETVEAVYDRLSNPRGKENGESSSHKDPCSVQNKHGNNGNATGVNETDSTLSDGDQSEPPGFGLTDARRRSKRAKTVQSNNIRMPKPNIEQREGNQGCNRPSEALPKPDNLDDDAPPGFSSMLKHKTSGEVSDEDPDVPPGFG